MAPYVYKGKGRATKAGAKKRSNRPRRKTTAKATSIKKVVNQVLARKVETKITQQWATMNVRCLQAATTQTQFNSTCLCLTPQGNSSVAIQQLYPIIGNSIAQDGRIGDECKIKSQYFDYILNANPYDAVTNTLVQPHIVTMYFIKPKNQDSLGLSVLEIVASSAANFFENQLNAESGMTGTFLDHLRKVDRDNFQVVATRTHKVGYSQQLNTLNQGSVFPNNDYKQMYKGRVKIPGYNWKVDRSEVYQGRNIYMFATYTNLNGAASATNQSASTITFNLSTYYTDM